MPPPPRRWFLRRLGLAGAGALAGAGLAGCAADDLAAVPRITAAADRSASERVVVFANWPQYVDQAGNPPRYPTLREFTRQTGIDVAYSEPINSNEEFLARIGIPLALGRPCGYDLMVLSDWVLPELIELGWLERLAPALTPNADRLLPEFANWPVPEVRHYALPWQGGFTGILYNERVTRRPVTSMTDLLTSPDLRGKVGLTQDMRDVMCLVMLDLGIDPASFGPRDFRTALAMIAQAVSVGQIKSVSEYYLPALTSGEIAATVGWAGDALFSQPDHPYVRFAWPQTGGMVWTDNMVIPTLARHPANAQRLMNFYYQPDVAAQLSAYEEYLCPVRGTGAAMRQLDPALARQKYIFPTKALLSTSHRFRNLTPAESADYTASYLSVVGL
jgi:spermidine/putrescine transport system substrate-binding protein